MNFLMKILMWLLIFHGGVLATMGVITIVFKWNFKNFLGKLKQYIMMVLAYGYISIIYSDSLRSYMESKGLGTYSIFLILAFVPGIIAIISLYKDGKDSVRYYKNSRADGKSRLRSIKIIDLVLRSLSRI